MKNLVRSIAAAMLVCAPVLAQTSFGTIVGNVSDTAGGAVPGAEVKITNAGTSELRTTQTGAAGTYTFVNLNPGTYRVEIEKSGFKRFARNIVDVQVNGTSRVDASLQLGDVKDSVLVTSEVVQVQTDSSSLGSVVTSKTIEDIPLNGRNVNNLLTLVPGVIAGGSTAGNAVSNQANGQGTNAVAFGNYSIGGGFNGQSAFFLDGVLSNIPNNNTNPLVPSQDVVQEFRVETNNVSAEFGGFGGGVVNLLTKSGTNRLHGSAYEYLRNRELNANSFFANRAGVRRPPFTQNQYGLTLGGPIRKDKTFFFFGWENQSFRSATLITTTMPTAAMLRGDFSSTGLPKIFDRSLPGSPQFQCNGVLNVMCPNRLDPSSVKLAARLFFAPTQAGNSNNFVANSPTAGDQHQYNGRLDHNFSGKNSLFGRYTYWTSKSPGSTPVTGSTVGFPRSGVGDHSVVVGDTHILNPTTVVDARIAYLRAFTFNTPLGLGTDMSQFGPAYAGIQAASEGLNPVPTIAPPTFGTVAGMNSQLYWTTNAYTLSGNVTKTVGRHTVKFGGSARQAQWVAGHDSLGGVAYTFNSQATANPADATTGYPFASFMLGTPTQSSIQLVGGVTASIRTYGLYIADTFQASKRLTLNLGLRWEQPGSYTASHDWNTVLLPDAPDPLGSIVNPVTGATQALRGQLALVNSPQWPDRIEDALHYKLFSPRIGFAFRLTDKTVLRAGYGISYLPATLSSDGPTNASINSATTTVVNSGSSAVSTVSNPFPGGILQPSRRDPAALRNLALGQSILARYPYQPYSYAQQWNATVERAFGNSSTLSVAYAGSKGTHLTLQGAGTFAAVNLNQLPDQYLSMGSDLLTQVANPFFGKISSGTLSGPTVAKGFLLRPFPQYLLVRQVGPRQGDSSYHSLQTSFRQRFSRSGTVAVAYTWSKLLANTDSIVNFLDTNATTGALQNNNNLSSERSLSSFDVPHNLVVSYGIDFPFGKGEYLLSNASGVLGAVISGWRLNGISTFQSGTPIALISGAPNNLSTLFGAGTIRPNVVAGCDASVSGSAQSKVTGWYNKQCYSIPGTFAFGNESRTDARLRTAGAANWDVSLVKSTKLRESMELQFNAEFFNIFNRVRFGPPDRTISSPTAGVVTSQTNLPRSIQFALRLKF